MKLIALVLFVLGLAASAGALTASFHVPDALAEFEREPEELYGMIGLTLVCAAMATYWICTSAWLFRQPRQSSGLGLRFGAVLVALFGCVAAVMVIVDSDTLDRPLIVPLALTCLASAALPFRVPRRNGDGLTSGWSGPA